MRHYEPPASFAALHSRPPFAPLPYAKRGGWRVQPSTLRSTFEICCWISPTTSLRFLPQPRLRASISRASVRLANGCGTLSERPISLARRTSFAPSSK